MSDFVPSDHPRAASLKIREQLEKGFEEGLVAKAGLFAHGRGEAFDYLLGEKTTKLAKTAIEVSAAYFLLAERPIISVNGNVAALVPKELVALSKLSGAPLEVNLFYRTADREQLIAEKLLQNGARKILGLGPERAEIEELSHKRRFVAPDGILIADVVFVPLEDGDRTEALIKMGKKVITVDLNPLSRTSQAATVSIVDNIVRALPLVVEMIKKLREESEESWHKIIVDFNNQRNLQESYKQILGGFPAL
ncbi:MAG: 4-phosphopantoate--beta-alanine ligase [Candidatus Heimdallarchaeota archaeon]